jgi:hypothetical protein
MIGYHPQQSTAARAATPATMERRIDPSQKPIFYGSIGKSDQRPLIRIESQIGRSPAFGRPTMHETSR